MGMLLFSWSIYIICYVVAMVDPVGMTNLILPLVKKENIWLIVIVWIISMVAMIVMCMTYGFWTMVLVHIVLGTMCGIRGYFACRAVLKS